MPRPDLHELEFAILGPLRVAVAGKTIELRSARQRSLLAALILRAGASVPRHQLLDTVWPDGQPQDPRAALQTQVMRLRRNLGAAGDAVRTDASGYLLDVDPLVCDVHRFRALLARAEADERPAETLREALALWRGEPLEDVASAALAPSAAALVEERLVVLDRRIALDLAAGRSGAVVAELSELTGQWPLREQFWAQLITALYRGGRQGDALAAYRQVRGILQDELGVEPGAELQRVHAAALAGTLDDGAADAAADASNRPPAPPEWTAQHQLPLDVTGYVGRTDLITAVQQALLDDAGVPIVVVSGLPGVGKSALALHAAHQVRDAFPDGQFYLNLGGGRGAPRAPEQLLDVLLRSTGVDPARISPDREAQSAVLRSHLAGRRVLVVLDDAATAEQIVPMLPGSHGCAVLVTSRNQLAELTALHGARPVPIDVMSSETACAVLESAIGAGRVAGALDEVLEIVELCGLLPLALRIAGANLAHQPDLPLADYAHRLRDNRVEELSIAGTAIGLGQAFDHSVDALPDSARRAFVLCAAAPTIDLPEPAVAALLDAPATDASRELATLCAANLLTRTAGRRYSMHDLLRDHAARRTDLYEPTEIDAARERLAVWYLQMVDAATMVAGYLPTARLTRPPVDEHPFVDGAAAQAWLEDELPNLVAVITRAATSPTPRYSWELTDALGTFLHLHRHFAPWRAIVQVSLAAAERAGDPRMIGSMENFAGQLAWHAEDVVEARRWFDRAWRSYQQAGHHRGAAMILTNIGVVDSDRGWLAASLESHTMAIEILHAQEMPDAMAPVLANRSDVHLHLGDGQAAVDDATAALRANNPRVDVTALTNRAAGHGLGGRYRDGYADAVAALDLCIEQGDVDATGPAQVELAYRCLDLGETGRALELADQARQLAQNVQDIHGEADALAALSTGLLAAGQVTRAVETAGAALEAARRVGGVRAPRALVVLARARHRDAGLIAAAQAATEGLELATELSMRVEQCRALSVLAAVVRDDGRPAEAEDYERRAVELASAVGYVRTALDGVGPGPVDG